MKVGEIIIKDEDIIINDGKKAITLDVKNTGERPVQIGSHFHFFEANISLSFDREKACGFRLDIPAGTAVRFEPKETKTVNLVEVGGKRKIQGANGLVNGFLDENRKQAIANLTKFCGEGK